MAYTDTQINDFLALAQEVGITRAKRELGYPNSWSTAKRWADLRGVTVAVDELKSKAAESREWYEDEELLMLAQEGFIRIHEEVTNNPDLTADDQKKLAEAGTKWFNIYASIKGKATQISETRNTDSMDQHLQELLSMERAKNLSKKENVTES